MTDFKVLGINYGGHDTSAVLMINGEPIACYESTNIDVLVVGDFMLMKGDD
jgi:predicted NodU family carbamoyl transferase